MHPHILSAFDKELEAVQAMVMRMGGLVEKALLDAAEALEKSDAELAQSVREGDKAIDALDLAIQNEAARIIALRAPAATDLRTILTVMRMATALERAGDYAKNLGKRTLILLDLPKIPGVAGTIKRMARQVVQQLSDALDAYIARDTAKANAVRARDEEIDQMYSGLFRELLTFMLEDPRMITPSMHLHFIAKNIERVGDHATSIAEQVIYLVEGQLPEEERAKYDGLASPLQK